MSKNLCPDIANMAALLYITTVRSSFPSTLTQELL